MEKKYRYEGRKKSIVQNEKRRHSETQMDRYGQKVRGKRVRWKKKSIDQKTGLTCPALCETNGSSSVSVNHSLYMVCLPVYLCLSCSPAPNA